MDACIHTGGEDVNMFHLSDLFPSWGTLHDWHQLVLSFVSLLKRSQTLQTRDQGGSGQAVG